MTQTPPLAQVDTAVQGDVPIGQLNAQAQQLVGSAFQAYGGLPNPRAAVEAMQANATPAVAAAMQVGSPAFDSILNSAPLAGPIQPSTQPQTLAKQQPLKPSADESQYADDWKSIGAVPTADTRWLAQLLQSQDTAAIKKWQNYLNANLWYSGKQPLKTSGHWDMNSQAALYSFLIARFTPTALYSQDQAERNRASTFLSAMGFDAQGLNQQQGSDPKWKNDIVLQWMHTHGPDITMRKSLDEWSSLYGDSNMSDAVRGLKESWWQNLTDGIPFIGQLLPWSSGHTADLTAAQLSDAEKAALAPALQDAHNNMGIFGVLNGWDQLRTKAILGAKYFFQDLFTQGKVENPWDPNSSTGQSIQAHANNLFAGLFGDDAAAKNPALANVANLFMNIADDPISYTGVGLDSKLVTIGKETGEGATLAEGGLRVGGGMAAARGLLLKPAVIRDAFNRGQGASHVLDTVLQPMNRVRQELSQMLGDPYWQNRARAAALIGERNPARVHLIDEIVKEKDAGRRLELLRQNYGYKIYDPSFAMNMMQAYKAYNPAVFARLSEGKQARLWWGGIGGSVNRGRQVSIDDPFDLADAVRLQGAVHNLPQAKVDELLHKALEPNMLARRQVVLETNALIKQAVDGASDGGRGFRQFVANVRQGKRSGFTPDDQQFYLAIKDPGGAIVEGSRRGTSGLTPEEQELLKGHNQDVDEAVSFLKEQLVELRQQVGDAPELATAQARVESQIEDLRATQQSTAAFSPQFNQWERWDYTPYEALAWHSPVLRNTEFVQRKLRIDQVMGLWKRAVLLKPASSLSITLGDETTRFLLSAMVDGRPQDVAKFFVDMVKARLGRGEIAELPRDLFFSAAKMFGEYSWDDHIPFDLDSEGYAPALEHYVNDLVGGGPEAKVWTKAIKDAGATGKEQRDLAHERLSDWLVGVSGRVGRRVQDQDAAEFLRRTGLNPETLGLDAKDQRVLKAIRATPEGKELTAAQRAVLKRARDTVLPIARQIHGSFMAVSKYSRGSREDIFDWIDHAAGGGRRSSKEVKDLVHRLRSTDPDALPVAVGRRMYAPGSPGASPMARFSNWYFHHVTDAMVNNQRRIGYGIKLRQYEQHIRSVHGGQWSESDILNQAAAEAKQWVQKNTYQGARSMVATANRDLFPFFGATANMSRFFMRQWARHPATFDPSVRFLAWQNQNSQNGGLHIPIPGLTNVLSAFGFNSGDDLTFDPSYAFFFSRDGLAGYLPGLGPLAMIPVKMAAQANPDVSNVLKQIPGFEYVDVNSPMVPWFERAVSAASIAATGKSFLEGVPLIGRSTGYYSRQELDAAQQQHAQYLSGQRTQDVSQSSVNAQVAAQTGLEAVLGAGLPLNVQFTDPVRAQLQPATQAFDAATSDAQKLQVIKQFPTAASLLLYYSPQLWNQLHPDQPMQDSDVRRTLTAQNPWLQPYATGKVASTAPGTQSGAELSTASYQQDLAAGRLRYLQTDEFIGKMLKNDQFNDAWSQYEVVHQAYMNWLVQSGNAPTSVAATQYRAAYVDPTVQAIGATHPDWYAQFVQQTNRSFSGLQVQSAPLRSLMSWEVMPHFDDMESPLTQLWRQALVYRDNAATALLQARGNNGEQQLILQALQQEMQALAQSDSTGVFGSQLNRFTFSKLSDLTQLEAQELYAQQTTPAVTY